MTLKVLLDNRGNPDFRQDPSVRLPGTRAIKAPVKDLEAASVACRRYIEKNELGGGNWTGGRIEDAAGNEVGRVSYNGTVWPAGPDMIGQEPLWPKPTKPAAQEGRLTFLSETLDVPGHGKITVSGCYRISEVRSVPGKFHLDGRRHDFSANMELDGEGLKSVAKIDLSQDGVMFSVVACPKAVRDVVVRTVRDWARSDDGKLMVLENEVRDRRDTLGYQERLVGFKERDLRKAETERDAAQVALDEVEALLSGMSPPAPRT